MRICYIANANSIHTQKWINYFIDKGHNILWLPPDKIKNRLKLIYLAHKFKSDILHAHYVGWNGLTAVLANIHPFFMTIYGSDILINQKNFFKRQVLKFILSKADLITTDAEHMRSHMQELGVSKSKIKDINFGIDIELFKPEPMAHINPTVISLRNLEPIYDIATLIKAIPFVLDKIPGARFIICGTGNEFSYLVCLLMSLGITNQVVFNNNVPNNLIPKLLNRSDVYVSTSLSDAGIAASTAEAMACGLVCLATDIDSNREWFDKELLFPCGNHIILADKIIRALGHEYDNYKMLNRYKMQDFNNYQIEMEKMNGLYKAYQRS